MDTTLTVKAGGDTHLDVVTNHIQYMHDSAAAIVNSDPLVCEYAPGDVIPTIIALYDDSTPASPDIKNWIGGELRGWAALEYDYYDNKQSLKGTRVVDKFTDTILPDGSRKRRFVVEFATTQALGAINKIRLYGRDNWASRRTMDSNFTITDHMKWSPYDAHAQGVPPSRLIYSTVPAHGGHSVYRTILTQTCGDYIMAPDSSVQGRFVVGLHKPYMLGDEHITAQQDTDLLCETGLNFNQFYKYQSSIELKSNGDLHLFTIDNGVWKHLVYSRATGYINPTVTEYPQVTEKSIRTSMTVLDGVPITITWTSTNFTMKRWVADSEPVVVLFPHGRGIENTRYAYNCTTPQNIYYHADTDSFMLLSTGTPETYDSGIVDRSLSVFINSIANITVAGTYDLGATIVGSYRHCGSTQGSSNWGECSPWQGYEYIYKWWTTGARIPSQLSNTYEQCWICGFDASRMCFLYGFGRKYMLSPIKYCGPILKLAESNIVEIIKTDEQAIRVVYEYTIKYAPKVANKL